MWRPAVRRANRQAFRNVKQTTLVQDTRMTHGTARQILWMAAGAALAAGIVSLDAQTAATPPQAATPSFEVASIKRNNSGSGNMTRGGGPGGRLNFVNLPVRQMII